MASAPQKLRDAMTRLSACESADQVAAFLRAEGVTGTPFDPRRCPLSNYLKRATGRRYSVDAVEICQKNGEALLDLTEAEGVFVVEFDSLTYLDLCDRKWKAEFEDCFF